MTITGRDLTGGLANSAGLARILGVSRTRVFQLQAELGFPEGIPLAGAPDRGSDVYPVAEVLRWRDEHRAAVDAARYPFPGGLRKAPCRDCGGTGWQITNPDWPSGADAHRTACATCSATGKIDGNE